MIHLFTLRMTRYPLYRRLGGPQGQSGRVLNITPPPGFDPRTVHTVASGYADWAVVTNIQKQALRFGHTCFRPQVVLDTDDYGKKSLWMLVILLMQNPRQHFML